MRWDAFRKFVLYGFGDAAALEAHKDSNSSVYTEVQIRIAKGIFNTCVNNGVNKIVMLAQSLGGQVISNYLWDAQKHRNGETVKIGIWKAPDKFANDITSSSLSTLSDDDKYVISGGQIRYLNTTGCNIPIFTAGQNEIVPINKPTDNFIWNNCYDKDDILGWPLKELYGDIASFLEDYPINAGKGFLNWLLKSWNPLSRNEYWEDDQVVGPLLEQLHVCIEENELTDTG